MIDAKPKETKDPENKIQNLIWEYVYQFEEIKNSSFEEHASILTELYAYKIYYELIDMANKKEIAITEFPSITLIMADISTMYYMYADSVNTNDEDCDAADDKLRIYSLTVENAALKYCYKNGGI